MRMPFVLATCLIGALAAGTTARAEPFSFRGLTVGTSIADVRRTRYPEAPNARIVCLHDEDAGDIRPVIDHIGAEHELKAGASACGLFTFGKATQTMHAEWLPTFLKINDVEVRASYWIAPDKPGGNIESDGRLYRIAMRANTANWPALRAAFIRRYGKPTTVEKGAMPTSRNLSVDNETLTWSNEASLIRLVQRASAQNRTMIVFQHKGLTPRDAAGNQIDGTQLQSAVMRRPIAQPGAMRIPRPSASGPAVRALR